MAANIEIKVRASSFSHQMSIAELISDAPPQFLHQEDTFFDVPHGRLKLRVFDNGAGELIFYDRPNQDGLKESHYILSQIPDPATLKAALTSALGIKGRVRKKRHLFMRGRIRIHFDEVEGLGDFIELEYVLKPEEDRQKAEVAVKELMERFNISAEDMIAHAYVDLVYSDAV